MDLAQLAAEDHDQLAEALEAGESVVLGVVPSREPATPSGDREPSVEVERWLDMLGLDPELLGDRLGVSPSCGLAGASGRWAREALRLSELTARNVSGLRPSGDDAGTGR